MAIFIDRINGQNYSENLVNSALSFNEGTWTVASGTGTASLNNVYNFEGVSCLKIENTVPASDITVTNADQDTTLDKEGNYKLSWFCRKDIALEVREIDVLIYKNAVLLDTQSFSIGNDTDAVLDINDTWLRFQSDTEYALVKNDVITFQFKLKGATTAELTTFVYIDAVMLNLADRNNTIAPYYVKPNETLNRLNDLPDLPTGDGNYQLTVSSGAYTWTTI